MHICDSGLVPFHNLYWFDSKTYVTEMLQFSMIHLGESLPFKKNANIIKCFYRN